MKKYISTIIATAMAGSLLCACASGNSLTENSANSAVSGDATVSDNGADNASGDTMSIVTTIFPEYDWVMNVLGDNASNAEVTMLLDNGVDLHSYQPTADDILKISTCDLFKDKKLARINIERMEILDLEKRCYRELSGGQQQRVLLARALCATRKVLLLDEPVSGLDPKVTAQMYELIQKLNKDGITIIMISHDIAAAVSYASHILHIGDDIFFGTRDEYKESEVGKLFLMQNKIALNTTNTINATNTINNTNTIKTIEAPGSNTVLSLGQGQGGQA